MGFLRIIFPQDIFKEWKELVGHMPDNGLEDFIPQFMGQVKQEN